MNICDIVKTYSENTLGKFSKHDALVACPSLGSSSVDQHLKSWLMRGLSYGLEQEGKKCI